MGTTTECIHLYLITFVLTYETLVLATVSAEFRFYKSNPNGELQRVVFGKSLIINCTTNDPNAVTNLYHKTNEYDNWIEYSVKNKANLKKTGDVYTVLEFGLKEEGWFQCRAINRNNDVIEWKDPSTRVSPSDQHYPKAKISPVKARLDVGDNVNFSCSTQYFNKIHWFRLSKDGSHIPIPKTQITQTYYSNLLLATLMIKNASTSDTGVYICIATFDVNNDSQRASLVVYEPTIPGIINHSGKHSSVVVRSMDNAFQLYCIYKGYPIPKVMWLKDNNEIIFPGCVRMTSIDSCKNSKYKLLVNDTNINYATAILTIFKVNYKDHGTYTCKAVNKKGSDSISIPVNVETGATILTEQRGQEILTTLGETVNISCSARGNPIPHVFWSRTQELKVLKHGKGNATLTLINVKKNDLGNYTCNATNFISDTKIFTLKEIRPISMPTAAPQGMKSEVITIIVVFICVGFFVFVIVICSVLYHRRKSRTNEYLLGSGIADYKIDPDRSLFEQCRHLPYDHLNWEFPEGRLVLGETLGTGAFGLVMKADAIGIGAFKPRDKSKEAKQLREKIRRESVTKKRKKEPSKSITLANQTVAIKLLKDGASRNDYTDLASELKILIHLGQHKNIVNILGACTRGRRLMVIIEYAPHGNLLSFLKDRRDIYNPNWIKTSNNPDQDFTIINLGIAAYQISKGMEFLASRKCVHRDLAARNILVGQNYVMKISDFGLARDIYQDDLYIKTSTGLLPIKWMALESLYDRVYTHMSDVWSYGILLWEIFTLGGTPYPTVPVEKLFEFLAKGCRMNQPDYCPFEIYSIMSQCWHHCPEQRPNFEEISERIEQIFNENVPEDTLGYLLLENERAPSSNHYIETSTDELNIISNSSQAASSPKHSEPPSNNNKCKNESGKAQITYERKPLIKREYVSQHESSV